MNTQYTAASGQTFNNRNIQIAASLLVSLIGLGITLLRRRQGQLPGAQNYGGLAKPGRPR